MTHDAVPALAAELEALNGWLRDLELSTALFLLHLLLIPVGFISWHRSMTAPAA